MKIFVLLSGVIVILFSIFAVRVSKYQRQKLINTLSSSLMYKTKDFKSIIANNSTALTKIRQIKKELIYSCIIVSIAMLSLWVLPDDLLKNFPKSISPFVLFEVWIVCAAVLILEFFLKTINERLDNEIVGGQKNE